MGDELIVPAEPVSLPEGYTISISEFRERVVEFQNSLGGAIAFSNATGGLFVKTRFGWSSYLYTKLCGIGVSLNKIIVNSAEQSSEIELDHTSIAAVSRNMLEASVMFCYLAQRGITDEQWELRRNVIWLHDATSRHKIFKSMEAIVDNNGGDADRKKVINDLRFKVSQSKLFSQLEEERRKKILAGSEMYVNGLRSAARIAGWDKHEFDGTYTYLSQHSHSAPVSFLRMAEHNINFSNPSDAQLAISSLALQVSQRSLNVCSRRIAELYPSKVPAHAFSNLTLDEESPLLEGLPAEASDAPVD